MVDLPTTDPRHPRKTVTLQEPRSYAIPGGPKAKALGEVEITILAEITRGGDDDRNAGR